MPYKDLERKKEWERLHRPQRLARRRELRRIEAEKPEAEQPMAPGCHEIEMGFLVPLIAGGAIAATNPKLGFAVGGLALGIAVIGKKDWRWWVVGIVVLLVAIFSYFTNENADELGSTTSN
jgi:hypothetical protein